MFLNPPSLPELRMWAQVKCSHRKPSSASIGRLHDLQISFEGHESGRQYRCLPFPLYSYLLYGEEGSGGTHRRRIETVGKAKVVASVWGAEFFGFFNSLLC